MLNSLHVVNHQSHLTPGRKLNNSRTALQAITGARLYASGQAENPEVAAACTGSSVAHVRAALAVLKSENKQLLDHALYGDVCLLEAAKSARRVVKLVDAYLGASEQDLVCAAKIAGRILAPVAVAAE
jgi:hypothetical protein